MKNRPETVPKIVSLDAVRAMKEYLAELALSESQPLEQWFYDWQAKFQQRHPNYPQPELPEPDADSVVVEGRVWLAAYDAAHPRKEQ